MTLRPISLLAHAAALLALALPLGAQESTPNPWFPTPEVDLGTHLEGEVAHGRWDFKNPHDAAHLLRTFQPSCTCTKATIHIGGATYTIENQPRPHSLFRTTKGEDGAEVKEQVEAVPVGPGEEGYIEFSVDLHGVNGVKEASVVIGTDDEANRTLTVRAKAAASQFFVVLPAEVNLNKMSWQESRQFTARITSPIQPDFEITGLDEPVPAQMKIDYRKEMNNGAATWVIDGTYGPNVDPHAGGGILNFSTNVQGRKVTLRVMAWVEGPLTVRPGGFVAFGRIPANEGASRTVEFEPNDDFDLQIESVELKNLTIDASLVTVTKSKDGKTCKLEITVAPNAPRRLVRGDIQVKLNHPAAALQELQFNGFVR